MGFIPDFIQERLADFLVIIAKIALWVQIVLGLVGSCAYAYSSLHGAGVAITVAGLIALETGTRPYIKLYCMLLVCMLLADVMYLSLWSVKIAKNDSSILGEYNSNEFRDSEKLALSATFICFFTRLASAPIWGKFLYSSSSEGSGMGDLGSGLLADEA